MATTVGDAAKVAILNSFKARFNTVGLNNTGSGGAITPVTIGTNWTLTGTVLSNTNLLTFNCPLNAQPTKAIVYITGTADSEILIDLTGGPFVFTTAGSFTIEAGGLTLEVA